MSTNYFSNDFIDYFNYVCLKGNIRELEICIKIASKEIKNIVSESNRTPLYFAISGGSFQSVKMLIESGIDFNVKDGEGKDSLIHAIEFPRLDIIRLLLWAGCSPELKDKHDKSAIDYCKEKISDNSIYSIISEEFNNWKIWNC